MDLEGGAISPTRALSMLLPKGEVLLFKVIKKKAICRRKEALHSPPLRAENRSRDSRLVGVKILKSNCRNQN